MNGERIIKIKGQENTWYEEAVFRIRKENLGAYHDKDLQERANMIIGNYAKHYGLEPKFKKKQTDQALNIILLSSLGILIICLYLL